MTHVGVLTANKMAENARHTDGDEKNASDVCVHVCQTGGRVSCRRVIVSLLEFLTLFAQMWILFLQFATERPLNFQGGGEDPTFACVVTFALAHSKVS